MNNIIIRKMVPGDLQRAGFYDSLETLGPVYRDLGEGAMVVGHRDSMMQTFVAVWGSRHGPVLGTASMIIEWKFIHNDGIVAHIEDVAVHPRWQRQGIGRALLTELVRRAREAGCYKILLDCKPELAAFYERCGFHTSTNVNMRLDLE